MKTSRHGRTWGSRLLACSQWCLTLFAILLPCVDGTSLHAEDVAEMVGKVKESVVVIESFDRNGDRVARASGFAVDKGVIATNVHVLEGGCRFMITRSDGVTTIVRGIWAFDRDYDIALLALADPEEKGNIPVLSLAEEWEVKEGMAIFVLGHPQNLKFTVSSGIISSTDRKLSEVSPLLPKARVIQTDAATSPGSSGGPWVNSSGRVVGVHRAGMSAVGVQGFNFATHVKYLQPLVSKHREKMLPVDFFSKLDLDLFQVRPDTVSSPHPVAWDNEEIYLHAPGKIEYAIPEGARMFRATGQLRGDGNMRFVVKVDGRSVFVGTPLRKGQKVEIEAEIPRGAQKLELVSDSIGPELFDWSYWIKPRLE